MQPVHTPDMSLAVAQALLTGVEAAAVRAGVWISAVVVDRGGNVVACMRMDEAQLGSMSLATDKAYTAVAFGHPTSAWSQSSAPGGSDWGLHSTLGGRAVVFPGGLPVFFDASLIGGIGVSGAASTVDAQCAAEGLTDAGLTGG